MNSIQSNLIQLFGSVATEVIVSVIATIIIAVGAWFAAGIGGKGRVGGKWHSGFTSDGTTHTEQVSSRHFPLGIVSGRSVVKWSGKDAGGRDLHGERRYRFLGLFKAEILTALYWCKDKSVTDRGAFVLKYKSGSGDGLVGKYIGLEGDENIRVENVDRYEWNRVPS